MRSFIWCVGAFAALQTVDRVIAIECPPLHILGAWEIEPAECVSYNVCVDKAGPVKLFDYKLPCETPLIALRCRHDLQTINPDGATTQCDYSILEFGDDGIMRRVCCGDGDGTESRTQHDGSHQVPLQPDDVETSATKKPKRNIVHHMEDSLPEPDEELEPEEHDRCESCRGGKLTAEEEGDVDDTETFKSAEGEEPSPGEEWEWEWEWEFEYGNDDQPWHMEDDQDAEEDHDSPLEEGEEREQQEEKEEAGDEIPEQEHVYDDEHLDLGDSEWHEDGTEEADDNGHPVKEPLNKRFTGDEPEWPWADQEPLGEEQVEERHNVRYDSDPRTPKDQSRPPKLDAKDPSYVWACYCDQGEAEQRILLAKL